MRKILLVFIIMLLTPSSALACMCNGKPSIWLAYMRAKVVVTATVVKHASSGKEVQLRFDKVWKGNAPKSAKAQFAYGLNSFCGADTPYRAYIDSQYLLFFNREVSTSKRLYITDNCASSSRLLENGDIFILKIVKYSTFLLYPIIIVLGFKLFKKLKKRKAKNKPL